MSQKKQTKLIKLSATYIFDKASKIALNNGYIEIGDEQFAAVGFEKSKAAQNWEDTDYFNIIILIKAADNKYYVSKIEHIAHILSPKYADDDMRVYWVEEDTDLKEQLLISNLYSLNDSRCQYTITILDKPCLFYEKYIVYTISVSYEIWDYSRKNAEISPFLNVRCKFSSQHGASALEDTPTQILEYPIDISSLLQTSIFQHHPFEICHDRVIIDGLIVTLEPE